MPCLHAFYELIEWWTALIGGESANDFLGTQGDIWDTQWDMFLALIGSITAQIALAQRHDRALNQFAVASLNNSPD
jgi:putative membrane protein